MNIREDYSTEELARVLLYLAEPNKTRHDTRKLKDCEYALYDLKNICENEYNNDAYRTLWDVLQDIPKWVDDMPEDMTRFSVYDLTAEEFAELKETYYEQLKDDGTISDDDEIETAEDIPDEVIKDHYADVSFTKDDFFCNQ